MELGYRNISLGMCLPSGAYKLTDGWNVPAVWRLQIDGLKTLSSRENGRTFLKVIKCATYSTFSFSVLKKDCKRVDKTKKIEYNVSGQVSCQWIAT